MFIEVAILFIKVNSYNLNVYLSQISALHPLLGYFHFLNNLGQSCKVSYGEVQLKVKFNISYYN